MTPKPRSPDRVSPAEPVTSTTPDTIRCVLESKTMERVPTLRALLSHLWQHRGEQVSEYSIATEALGRRASFDPRTDATVRVQISRLRQRLEKFYDEEGCDLPERIVIPLGGHDLRVERRVVVPSPDSLPAGPAIALKLLQAPPGWAFLALAALALLLGIALIQSRISAKPLAGQTVPGFWKRFFANGRPSLVILPTPVFFNYGKDASAIMLRDTTVNEFTELSQKPFLIELQRKLGKPRLSQAYTVTSDTFAIVTLARYLDRFSLPAALRSSADAPLEALDSENVIALGTWGTLMPLKPYLDSMELRLLPNEQSVELRHPAEGEPARIDFVHESAERGIWPGVVAVLPGRGGGTRLLVLASRHTSALVTALTSTSDLDQIERMWSTSGSPEYFEMVINSEMNGKDLVKTWPVLLHPARSIKVTGSN